MIRQGWTNPESGRLSGPRIHFLKFEMLQNTIENNAKKLTINLDVKKIKIEKIKSLYKNLKNFKGNKSLYFNVYDSSKKIKLALNSKNQKIRITSELLNELEINDWLYKLN